VIEGDAGFFAITKRIHNGLYGSPGDGGPLGDAERSHYEQVLRRNTEELLALIKPGDLALIRDPQPAGMVEAVRRADARVVWRCHVGCDRPNEWTERAWEFLRPYLQGADGYVVSGGVRAALGGPGDDARDRAVDRGAGDDAGGCLDRARLRLRSSCRMTAPWFKALHEGRWDAGWCWLRSGSG
jgi:hypothetical protein